MHQSKYHLLLPVYIIFLNSYLFSNSTLSLTSRLRVQRYVKNTSTANSFNEPAVSFSKLLKTGSLYPKRDAANWQTGGKRVQ